MIAFQSHIHFAAFLVVLQSLKTYDLGGVFMNLRNSYRLFIGLTLVSLVSCSQPSPESTPSATPALTSAPSPVATATPVSETVTDEPTEEQVEQFHASLRDGKFEDARTLLEQFPSLIESKTKTGNTVAHSVAGSGRNATYGPPEEGSREFLETFVKGKSDVNARSDSGSTALHAAAYYGHLEATKFLIENGADVNAVRSSDGETPLHKAASTGKLKVAELLLQAGARTDIAANNRKTPADKARLPKMKALMEKYKSKK